MNALDWFESIRWPLEDIKCPKCGHENDRFQRTGGRYWCTPCKGYFSVRTGTAMEHSRLKLDVWHIAIHEVTMGGSVYPRSVIRAKDFAKVHRISSPAAWRVLWALRGLIYGTGSRTGHDLRLYTGADGPALTRWLPVPHSPAWTPAQLAAKLFE